MFLESSQNVQKKKETLTQVSSCEFCEISKNVFSYKTPPVAASDFISPVIARGSCTDLLLISYEKAFCFLVEKIEAAVC